MRQVHSVVRSRGVTDGLLQSVMWHNIPNLEPPFTQSPSKRPRSPNESDSDEHSSVQPKMSLNSPALRGGKHTKVDPKARKYGSNKRRKVCASQYSLMIIQLNVFIFQAY